MNPAGAQILTTLILAKECGIDVNPVAFDEALRYFYRFAGHAAVPYGDHHPEIWLSCNGKNGMLAVALSLVENEACQLASQHMAMDMADSYRWLLSGHTGGGFDVIWRGLSTVHAPASRVIIAGAWTLWRGTTISLACRRVDSAWLEAESTTRVSAGGMPAWDSPIQHH